MAGVRQMGSAEKALVKKIKKGKDKLQEKRKEKENRGKKSHSSIGFQSQMFWGLISQRPVLKVRCPWDMHLSLLREKLWVLNSLPVVRHCGFMETLCLGLSYPLWCGFPLIFPLWRDHSTNFQVFSRGNCSYIAGCPWEEGMLSQRATAACAFTSWDRLPPVSFYCPSQVTGNLPNLRPWAVETSTFSVGTEQRWKTAFREIFPWDGAWTLSKVRGSVSPWNQQYPPESFKSSRVHVLYIT